METIAKVKKLGFPSKTVLKLQREAKEREQKILDSFFDELKGDICADSKNVENIPLDIYSDVKNKGSFDIYKYLHKKIKKSAGKEFKGVNMREVYEYWLTILIEKTLCINPSDKNYDPESISGWIMKQLSKRADIYQTIAFVKALRKIWLNGNLSNEFKQYVKDTLEEYGEKTNNYGILRVK